MKSLHFEDYVAGTARASTGRTVTEADIVLHAGQTGDFYPHHMDAEWCKTQDFKQRIAHGTLIFSVAVGQTAGEINPEAFSYGYDRLRFIRPVFIGDTITTRCTVTEKSGSRRPTSAGRLSSRPTTSSWCAAGTPSRRPDQGVKRAGRIGFRPAPAAPLLRTSGRRADLTIRLATAFNAQEYRNSLCYHRADRHNSSLEPLGPLPGRSAAPQT